VRNAILVDNQSPVTVTLLEVTVPAYAVKFPNIRGQSVHYREKSGGRGPRSGETQVAGGGEVKSDASANVGKDEAVVRSALPYGTNDISARGQG